MHIVRTALASLWLMLLAACTAVNPDYDPAKPHHTASGFKNNYAGSVNKKFSELVQWQIERRQQGLPKLPAQLYPRRHRT